MNLFAFLVWPLPEAARGGGVFDAANCERYTPCAQAAYLVLAPVCLID